MLVFPRHWKIWLAAWFAVVAAHALVATALVTSWDSETVAAASAPMTVTLALEATTNAARSQVAVAAKEKPKPKREEPKPVKTAMAEKFVPKPKPEEKPQPVQPQKQLTHIDAKMAEETQAQQQGGSEQALEAKQLWYGQVLALLQKQKRYPRLALMRSEQGVAKVHFELDRNGQLLAAKLEDSSGYHSLDEEALALVRRVSPFPAPPSVIAGERISLDVPVAFQVNQ